MSDVLNPSPISIFIAHYNRMSCELLTKAFEETASYRVIARVVTAAALMDSPMSLTPDIALISATLQDGRSAGLTALRHIYRTNPKVRSILLLDIPDRQTVVDGFRAGARGIFCPSQSSFEMLCRCVSQVQAGEFWATAEELSYVMEAFADSAPPGWASAEYREILSRREQEVVGLVASGLTNKEIARVLALSEHTIKNYLFRIFEKLGVSSRVQVASHMTGMVQMPEAGARREVQAVCKNGAAGAVWCATESVGAA